MDLGTTTAWIDRFGRVQARLSDTLGRWLEHELDAAVALYLATQANHHGWHADLWADRRPSADRPPAEADLHAVDRFMDEVAGAEGSLERMVALSRVVLPRLVTALNGLVAVLDERLDAPTVRIARLVLADETEAWHEGERLVQHLMTGPDDAAKAALHQARLEGQLVESRVLD